MPVIAACGGKVISIGNNQADLQKIDPTKFVSQVGACPPAYQHPNICCEGGATTPSTCGAYLDAPFRPCDSGWATYPNAAECCSLDDPSKCMASTSTGIGRGGDVCNWACPPGWWPEPASKGGTPSNNSGSCCQLLSSGGTICQSWNVSVPISDTCAFPAPPDPVPQDAGPGPFGDAGVVTDAAVYDAGGYDAGIYACDAGTTPYVSGTTGQNCSCPLGFNVSGPEGDVCCRNLDDGSTECFSVANNGPSQSSAAIGGSGNGGSSPPSVGGAFGGG